jgi:hypothetical protein
LSTFDQLDSLLQHHVVIAIGPTEDDLLDQGFKVRLVQGPADKPPGF